MRIQLLRYADLELIIPTCKIIDSSLRGGEADEAIQRPRHGLWIHKTADTPRDWGTALWLAVYVRQEREATTSGRSTGTAWCWAIARALSFHVHLGNADLRYIVKMTSDGIDPATVTYSEVIYKPVCDL